MSDADTRLELPKPSKDHLAREAEARRILDVYGDDLPGIMAMLERQFAVLHNRAQVALVLCGVVISTTGFSGRLVAGTNALSQWLIISGLSLIILAAGVVVRGVLHLRWLTMQGGQDTAQWLVTSLAYRDKKTAHYRVGVIILLVGLILYGGALAVTLLNPEEDQLPPRSRVQASSSVMEDGHESSQSSRGLTARGCRAA
ncbi:MAG: hypothetical protein AAGI46_02505 [Planctomycetota bacterium]